MCLGIVGTYNRKAYSCNIVLDNILKQLIYIYVLGTI